MRERSHRQDEEKCAFVQKYETLAQKDHERYDREMEDYDPPPEFQKKDNDKPKKPRSSYVLWCSDNRAAVTEEGMKPTEVMKKLGEAWKKVDEKTKKVRCCMYRFRV